MTLHTPTPDPPRRSRPVLAGLATATVTAISLPVHLFLAFMFSVASNRYDTTGQGAPFKNCDLEEYCSDPSYGWMLGTASLMVLLWLVAAQVGQLAWDPRPRLVRVLALTAFSAILTAAGCTIVYYLLTHRISDFFS